MFSCEFYEISKSTFSYRKPPVAASGKRKSENTNQEIKTTSSHYLTLEADFFARCSLLVPFYSLLVNNNEFNDKFNFFRIRVSEALWFVTHPDLKTFYNISTCYNALQYNVRIYINRNFLSYWSLDHFLLHRCYPLLPFENSIDFISFSLYSSSPA